MANMFIIEGIFEGDIRETEKAWGIYYSAESIRCADSFGYREQALEWFPKSQCKLTCINEEFVKNCDDGFEHDREYALEVPMWLARKHDYYKHTLLRARSNY